MDVVDLVNGALTPALSMADVAAEVTRLEQQKWAGTVDEELNVLGGVARLWDDPGRRFPFIEVYEHRLDGTIRHGQYSGPELDVLERLHSQLTHPGLRARVQNFLHSTRPNHLLARAAVRSYMDVARQDRAVSTDAREAHEVAVAWGRAADLSKRLGNNNALHAEVLEGMMTALACHQDDDHHGWFSFRLLEVLLQFNHGGVSRCATFSATLAKRAEALGNLGMANRHWGMAARWYRRAGNVAAETAAKIEAAEMLVLNALHKADSGLSPLLVGPELTRAVQALRESGAPKARVEEVHQRLREVQHMLPEGLKSFEVPIPPEVVQRLQKFGQRAVEGVTALGIFSALSRLMVMPARGVLRQQARDAMDGTIHWQIAQVVIQDAEGRVQPSPGNEEKHLEFGTYQQQDPRRFLIDISLEAAMKQIQDDHSLTPEDLNALILDHPFVPHGHHASLRRGLQASLDGDFLAAIPVLIPQIEAMLRYVLTTQGVVTSGLDTRGVQQEHNLNNFLADEQYVAVLGKVFDEALLFDLRGLLVEKWGKNLRNLVAHGMATDGEMNAPTGRYIWGLVLQLLMSVKDEKKSFGQMDTSAENSLK